METLWVEIIKSIYGEDGGMKEVGYQNKGCKGTWGYHKGWENHRECGSASCGVVWEKNW